MKSVKATFILSAVALCLVACAETKTNTTNNAANTIVVANANAQPSAAVDELAASKPIYLESCTGCHREQGEGGEAEFEGKKIKVPSYQSKGAMNASDDKLYNYIADGEEDEMPAFKDKLTEEQMRNLVKFIRKEFQKK